MEPSGVSSSVGSGVTVVVDIVELVIVLGRDR